MKNKQKKAILNGQKVDFDACVYLMDDEIREELHSELAPCEAQKFLDAYCKRHLEKFEQEFSI